MTLPRPFLTHKPAIARGLLMHPTRFMAQPSSTTPYMRECRHSMAPNARMAGDGRG